MSQAWKVGLVLLVLLFAPAASADEGEGFRASLAARWEPLNGSTGVQLGVDHPVWAPHRWVQAHAGLQAIWIPDVFGSDEVFSHFDYLDLRLLGVAELSFGGKRAWVKPGLVFMAGPQLFSEDSRLEMERLGLRGSYQHTEVVLNAAAGLVLRVRVFGPVSSHFSLTYDLTDLGRSAGAAGLSYSF
jgi:hypothetical protein